jgi:hypothetical protein
MARIFFAIAAVLFFLAAVGAHIIPHSGEWGLVSLALGFAVGGWTPWKRSAA